MKKIDVIVGEVYLLVTGESGRREVEEVFIVGYDPITKSYIGSCEDWLMKVSEITDDDFEMMSHSPNHILAQEAKNVKA